jgi:hypothetical protein
MKALTVKALTKALANLASNQIEVTLNLAYHATVHGNVEPLAGRDKNVTSLLHKDYKALIAASYTDKNGVWVYNKTKAVKVCEQYGLTFGVTTFDEFVIATGTVQAKPVVDKTDAEKRAAMIKRVDGALAAALAMGIDIQELILMAKNAKAKV